MDWQSIFFQNWQGIIRTVITGVLSYAVLIVFLRISGKRTLAKLNAFDLVVTVALGSTLSAVLLQETVALAEGAVALGLLIFLQFCIAFASVRSSSFAKFVRAEPALLARDGRFCLETMRRERMTEAEVLSAVRTAGAHRIEEAATVILESDGSVSVSLATAGGLPSG